jgi:hypothetical protein
VNRKTGLGLGLIVLVVAALYCWTLLSASEGRPIAPLDDTYIHFQYARQIARGHPWQYNDGDPRSTGATSPLYPFVLAAGYVLGFTGERLAWFALALGILSLALSTWLIYRITRSLLEGVSQRDTALVRWTPTGAAVLFVLTGAIQWAFMSGMESGLFTLFVLAALDAVVASPEAAPAHRAAFWVAMAALTRPEGLVLAGVLWLVTVGQSLSRHQAGHGPGRFRSLFQEVWPISLAVLIGASSFLINLALTGSPIATGAQAKSWLGNVPFRPGDILGSILGGYRIVMERFTIGPLASRPWFLTPGVLLLAIAGWLALLRQRKWSQLALTLGWFFLGVLATASLITVTWQVGRYQVPFLAVLAPLAALGLVTCTSGLPKRWRGPIVVGLASALLAGTLISTLQARSLYQRSAYTVKGQHLAIADWIRHNLPAKTLVGVHDTGAIRYVGQRPTYDMIGLTTQGAATAWRHGAGAIFERLERSPVRPDYFATYPDVISLPYLVATDLFAAELFRVEVPDFAIASAGPVQAVYRADWSLAGSGDHSYQADTLRRTQGLELADHLDLADLEDEAAHELYFWEGTIRPGFPTEVQQYRYRTDPALEVLDGGRLVNGGLAFRVAAQPGQPLLLVARLHPMQAGAVRVSVDAHDLGLWRYPALPGEWLETAFYVPAAVVTRDNPEIRFEVDTTNPAFRHFALYYLWVWQGQPAPYAPQSEQSLSARLGDAVELVGYDLPPTSSGYRPGETVQLVLYWRAVIEPARDAKVFVHLYDPNGEIVTQADQRPYHGTRPPYTWAAGEMLDDPYALALPPDLAPGRYTLGLGMYDPVTGARLPVQVTAEHRLSENRILLSSIDIVTETE